MPATLMPHPSATTADRTSDEGLNLLLDLLTERPAEEFAAVVVPAAPRPELRVRVHEWVRRAAAWGSGPDGAWRAW